MNISLEGFWGMEERWKDDSGAFRPGRWDARSSFHAGWNRIVLSRCIGIV